MAFETISSEKKLVVAFVLRNQFMFFIIMYQSSSDFFLRNQFMFFLIMYQVCQKENLTQKKSPITSYQK